MGQSAKSWIAWGTLALLVLAFGVSLAMLFDVDQMPEHAWRTYGPGSDQYAACYDRMKAEAGNFRLDSISAEHSGETWTFRWRIMGLTADASPMGPAIYTCVYRDGRANLEEPEYPIEWD